MKIKKQKTLLLMFGFLALSACNLDPSLFPNAVTGSNPGTDSGSTPSPTATPSNSDVGTGGLKVVIHEATNYDSDGLGLLEEARALLERVVNTEEFKQRILGFTYSGQQAFAQNNDLSNLQIYNSILQAAEQLPAITPANQTMDLYVQRYTSSYFGQNVVGYTNASESTIYMNSYFFDSAKASDVAANMMHEWLHKLGFTHDYYATAQRPYSVPYAIGDLIGELAAKY